MNIISNVFIYYKNKMAEEATIQNWNPYNLIDNNQKGSNTNSESKPTEQFLTKIVKKIAKMAWLPDPETWKPFTEWDNTKAPVNTETTLEQDVVAKEEKAQEEEKKKLNFDNIMSWVTWVLDKIGKKVSEKTWIDLSNPLKKKEESPAKEETLNNTETQQTQLVQEPQKDENTENSEATQNATENQVEKNNEEYLKS